ncbi:hypothetical protein [Hymenobacter rigui]|uniref:Uncharacterized protein n=1 Tax=Hymenobacter rigui TaxID=334424 RepID=A0A3R9NN27_9BACT|nr:hypothetical protein [Hymenobacter rigui]RSK50858.1 hypothetical protein EI291_00625 [Hymenobacter rigui]
MRRLLPLLGATLLLWGLLVSLLLGPAAIWHPTIDVQLHNTYFVLDAYTGQLLLILPPLALVLLVSGLQRRLVPGSTWWLLVAGSCALVLFLCTHFLTTLLAVGFTIYPPLTASEPYADAAGVTRLYWLLRALQALCVVGVWWAGVQWGRRSSTPVTT